MHEMDVKISVIEVNGKLKDLSVWYELIVNKPPSLRHTYMLLKH